MGETDTRSLVDLYKIFGSALSKTTSAASFTMSKTYYSYPSEEWAPFGSVLERPDEPGVWDPGKAMLIAVHPNSDIEIVHLIGPKAGERERANPFDWRVVPEDES